VIYISLLLVQGIVAVTGYAELQMEIGLVLHCPPLPVALLTRVSLMTVRVFTLVIVRLQVELAGYIVESGSDISRVQNRDPKAH
jgi:hypothetical protein